MGPGPGPAGAPKLDPLVTTGMIRRADMRRQLRVAQQLKTATLILVAMLLLAAYPVYLFVRAGAQDPVFDQLNGLDLPSWATMSYSEVAVGSRWCIETCRYHTRTYESERAPDETNVAYKTALEDAGWRLRTEGPCPAAVEGLASCWYHDEYVLDMWVRAPICDVPPQRPSASANPNPGSPGSTDTGTAACPGALVTMKVYNAISYRGGVDDVQPSPTTSPSPTKSAAPK